MKNIFLFVLFLSVNPIWSQQKTDNQTNSTPKAEEKKWYEKMKWSGYAQFRYNRLLETNPDLKCESCDRSWGDNQSFFFRRARLVYQGYAHERLFTYIQVDYAAAVRNKSDQSENLNFLQLRDAYFDYGFDSKNEYRLRVGLTKVPYGLDNMQSSGVRLPMDRSDALNSGAPNERDMGAFFLWSPENVRKLQRDTLTSNGFKGHGDYGVFMIGAYTGQSANKPELNDQVHVAAKLSYPFRVKKQIIEPALMAYSGRYVMTADALTANVKTAVDRDYADERVALGVMMQPKPIGFVAEYTIGRGPEYNTTLDSIATQRLEGGYATLSYRIKTEKCIIQPFARAQYYKGGKKLERDARHTHVNEYEMGVEWLIIKNMELTASYVISHRRTSDKTAPYYDEKGNLLRLQLQYNY